MRNLKDWLGHRVLVAGNIQQIYERSYCIDNVRVKEYSSNPEVRSLDHIWTFFDKEAIDVYVNIQKHYPKCMPRLKEKVGFVGYVIEYRRKDGSKDYGIQSIPTTSWILHGRKELKIPARKREEIVVNMISLLKKKEVFYDFEKKSYQSYLDELYDILKHIRWEIEVDKFSKRMAKESMVKTKRGDLTPDPVKFKVRKLESPKGFSANVLSKN